MAVSYKKLWHLLIDRDMKKMSRDENVTTEVLGKICAALNCKVEDIVDFLPDNDE